MHKIVDGKVVELTPEEIAEFNARQEKWATEEPSRKAVEVRGQRDVLLSQTDWIVIKAYERNENIPMEWEIYRQALRDITAQEGFPFNVTWPEKPTS